MTTDAVPSTADLLETVQALGPVFRAHADQVDVEGRYPREGMQALREAGLLMLPVAREYGGPATGSHDTSDALRCNRIFSEIARHCSNTSQVYMVHCLCVRPLLRSGTREQREFVADAVRNGAAIAVAAAEGGRSILDLHTTFRCVDGGYILNGTKTFCTGHGGAAYVSVFRVREEGAPAGDGPPREFNCLVPMDAPGVIPHNDWDNLGQRGTTSGAITFQDVFLSESLVWPTAQAPYYGLTLQAGIMAVYQGIGEGALAAAAEYVRSYTRPYPLAGVERAVDDANIQWHMGDLTTRLHLSALALDHASEVMEAAELSKGPSRAEASLAIAKAKIATTTAALETAHRMFQVMGARATARKHRLDRYWRDIRTLSLHDPVDQKYRLIGRHVLTGAEPPITFHT